MLSFDPLEACAETFEALPDAHFLDRAMACDMSTWMADDILVKVDRATMAYGLESRAPFLDHRIVEFAASLPVDYKLKGITKKFILKESQKARLPASIIHRSKKGFNAPISHWLLGTLREYAYSELTHPALLTHLRREAIDKLWQEHQTRTRDHGFKLLALLTLSLWLTRTTRTLS